MSFPSDLLDTAGFPPRWRCGSWTPAHGWLHVGSDLAIFGAYFAIPVVMAYFLVRRRNDVPFLRVFWLFAAFILCCGVGHAVEATLFWHPWYRLSGLIKFVTAVVSWATVAALIPLTPQALALPGLAKVNARLAQEIADRERAEAERRQLEAQFRQAQKLESLGVLAGGIAHDFNNLLTSVLGYSDLARAELPENSTARGLIEEAMTGARRAAELTNQMLAYSGKGRFVVEPTDLSDVVAGMARLLQVSVSKKCDLHVRAAPGLPAVEADAPQVRQVVMNLLMNAADAVGDRGGAVRVETGAADFDRAYLAGADLDGPLPAGRYVYLEVADTGCGMSAETLGKIFDPFFTTKFTGRGLGLAAVLGIVRGHRGGIKVTSVVGVGSTFRVLFPASDRAAPAPPATPPADRWRSSGVVLVVDDEAPVRELAARMLAGLGFTVLTAGDGVEGVEVFRREADRVRLVLLDLTMPRMGGEEALREIRAARPDARVLLTSGYTDRAAGHGAAAGADGFVQKPYDLGTLARAVRAALER